MKKAHLKLAVAIACVINSAILHPSHAQDNKVKRPSITAFHERHACGVNTDPDWQFIKKNETIVEDSNKRYDLFRSDDERKIPCGLLLKVRNGEGLIWNVKKMKLADAEALFGKSRENRLYHSTENPQGLPEQGCRVFDLIAVDLIDRNNVKDFTLYVKVVDNVITDYVIDGPGITWVEPKKIEKKE
jgi:hypothetical protein